MDAPHSLTELEARHDEARARLLGRVQSGALAGKRISTLKGVAIGLNASHTREQIRGIAEHSSGLLGFYDDLWQAPEAAFEFQWQGLAELDRTLATGRGAILVTSHFGPYRWLAPELLKRGFRLTLLVDEAFQRLLDHDVASRVHKVYSQLSHDLFNTVSSGSTSALWHMARALKQGRVVLSFADGNSGVDGKAGENGSVELPFLGQSIRARPGIAALARASGAALLPVRARNVGTRGHFEVGPAFALDKEAPRAESLARCTRALFGWLEEQILQAPEAWEEWWLLPSWLAGKLRVPCERTARPDFRVTLPGLTRARLALPDNTVWTLVDGQSTSTLDLALGVSEEDPLCTSLFAASEHGHWARQWLDAQTDTSQARSCLEREVRVGRVVLSHEAVAPLLPSNRTEPAPGPETTLQTDEPRVELGPGCIRCAAAASIAPELFDVSSGANRLRRQPANEHEFELAKSASLLCPVRAIRYREATHE
jgi:lauroyl/myristoyl acyltransferase/ferredoxin